MVTSISIRPFSASIRNFAAAALLFLLAGSAYAQDHPEPGTCESAAPDPAMCGSAGLSIGKASAVMSLSPYATFTGNIAVSVDGVGTNGASATVRVEKPSDAATVRTAYLMTATTGFSASLTSNITISRGANSLTITPTDYDQIVASAISSENGIVDVTSFIATSIDPEPAGTYDFEVAEEMTFRIDGEILVVIFDEPSAPTSTYVLTFGAQDLNGDTFSVTLSEPFDDSAVDITMALGISFSAQTTSQYSIIEVNGKRLTTAAGGQDDGSLENGALITVGGIGDDPANPANPNSGPSNTRSDDELYTIDPFLNDGDTQIAIFSSNPSNDDNIFFAGFLIRGSTAVIGEGILLTPPSAIRPVGTSHTMTAFLQDDNGDPVVNRNVDFEVISGPMAGMAYSSNTDAAGKATFVWSSSFPGKDVVKASFVAGNGSTLSTTAEVTWEQVQSAQCDLPRITGEVIDPTARTITLTFEDADGIAGISYRYPADYPDVAKAGQPALINLNVIDDGGLTTTNGIDFTATAPNPTVVTQVLEVVGSGRVLVTYFPLITDACQSPGPQTYDADPIRQFSAGEEVPATVTLEGNFPNPFNPTTMIRFALPEAMDVSVRVFDVLGREVATLLNESRLSAGPHELRFDAEDLPSGIYLFSVQANDQVEMGRMILSK